MFGLQLWHFLFFIILWVLGILGIALGILFSILESKHIYIYLYIYLFLFIYLIFFFFFFMNLGIYIFSVIFFFFFGFIFNFIEFRHLNLAAQCLLPLWNLPCITPLKYHALNFVRIGEDLTIFSTIDLEFMTRTSHLDISPICVQ